MKRVLIITFSLFGLFLVSWLVFTALGILTPEETETWLGALDPVAAAATLVGLLAADIVLPIPGSIVLSSGGIVTGWPVATVAGTAGLVLGSLVGYAACRAFGRRAFDRFVSPGEAGRFGTWLERYGPAAIILSRPVPMMSETLACLAGLSGMRWSRFAVAVIVGSAPYAWFFAFSGDRLGRVREEPGLALFVALAVPAAYWLGFALIARRAAKRGTPGSP
jgi:uncharacterized membrane protein YdjX (TVP38/TMEM64 family)